MAWPIFIRYMHSRIFRVAPTITISQKLNKIKQLFAWYLGLRLELSSYCWLGVSWQLRCCMFAWPGHRISSFWQATHRPEEPFFRQAKDVHQLLEHRKKGCHRLRQILEAMRLAVGSCGGVGHESATLIVHYVVRALLSLFQSRLGPCATHLE